MIVNNWYDTVNMFAGVTNPYGPRFYFVSWYVIVTFIITNLVIAFVMEIYGDTACNIEREHERRRTYVDIYERMKDRDTLSECPYDEKLVD